jgi:predicted transglutaminase-like cysteine proteinase
MLWALFLGLTPVNALSRPDLGFTTLVSNRLVDDYTKRFGQAARRALKAWQSEAHLRRLDEMHELTLLGAANQFFNRLNFADDNTHWGVIDYWGTPAESVASMGADCEDFAIAKYFFLKELGIPITKLRLTYVKAVKLNQAHMVLAYYPRPQAEPLVLDNLDASVRPASQRHDLVPVYSFNDEEVWIEAQGSAGAPGQLRTWGALVERLEREARFAEGSL